MLQVENSDPTIPDAGLTFTHLNDRDVPAAYALLLERIDDLHAMGIRQYEQPYPPMEMFRERQQSGFNYALYDGGSVAGIVSLIPDYTPDTWRDHVHDSDFIWITSLFTSLRYKGRNIGYTTLRGAEQHCRAQGWEKFYLDCYAGKDFLSNYYARFGFRELVRKEACYSASTFAAVLMMKHLGNPESGRS